MKKTTFMLMAGALMAASACTSTTTETATNNTAETATTTDAATGTTADSGTGTTAGTTTETATGTTTGTIVGTSAANPAPAGTTIDMTNMTDAMFLMTAASSNMLEIQAGELASKNAANAEVKQYGQMMVQHHTKASQELMSLASKMSVTLPTSLMPPHQALLDKLTGKTGKAFDEDYMDAMEVAHNMDIAMFQMKSKAAETPDVKALATKTLPMLKTHKQRATDLEDKVD